MYESKLTWFMWGIDFDLISVQGLEITWFWVGVEITWFLVYG